MSKFIIKINIAEFSSPKYLTPHDRLGMTAFQAQLFESPKTARNFISNCSKRLYEKDVTEALIEIIEVDENRKEVSIADSFKMAGRDQLLNKHTEEVVFDFDIMMSNLYKLIRFCEDNMAFIKSKEDLEDLPLKNVRQVVNNAKIIQSKMDSIMKNELYHVIGMANLTTMQELMFIDSIKHLLKYRSYVKSVATISIPTLPDIPDKSNYECKILGVNLTYEF